jgi:hypothetical protein
MEDDGIFYGHLVQFTVFCYIYGHLVQFVVIWCIFPVLVFCTKKNMATLVFTLLALIADRSADAKVVSPKVTQQEKRVSWIFPDLALRKKLICNFRGNPASSTRYCASFVIYFLTHFFA